MKQLTAELAGQMEEEARLNEEIRRQLAEVGWEVKSEKGRGKTGGSLTIRY